MRELFLQTLGLKDAAGETRHYDYFILIDDMDVGPYSCESYGVKIAEQEGGQAAVVPHVTCSISRIDELSELLLHNQVTPVTLKEVVADWL